MPFCLLLFTANLKNFWVKWPTSLCNLTSISPGRTWIIAVFHTDWVKCLIFFFLFVPGSEDKNYETSISVESPCWPFPEFSGEWWGRSQKVGTWGVNGIWGRVGSESRPHFREVCLWRRHEGWGWDEESEVGLIEEDDTSTHSNTDGKEEVERGRLRMGRKRAYSGTDVSEKEGGPRVQSTGGGLARAEGRCDGRRGGRGYGLWTDWQCSRGWRGYRWGWLAGPLVIGSLSAGRDNSVGCCCYLPCAFLEFTTTVLVCKLPVDQCLLSGLLEPAHEDENQLWNHGWLKSATMRECVCYRNCQGLDVRVFASPGKSVQHSEAHCALTSCSPPVPLHPQLL